MVELPPSLDLHRLGLDPSEVTGVSILHESHGHALYRLTCGMRSFVLKWFSAPGEAIEVRAYALLRQYGVPTLPLHGRADNALLLEDLEASSEWRLATEDDTKRAETGAAVAEWYRALHVAGFRLLSGPGAVPGFLRREIDALDARGLLGAAERLNLAGNPVWRLAAEHIEALKVATRALPTTLNYNDFDWTNLALSRVAIPALRAVVFDYHLLGIGPAYSDYRNVSWSLSGPAREAFQAAFGPPDAREAVLDAATSVLYSLYTAAQLPRLPGWARDAVGEVTSGDLEAKLRQAIAVL